jgi:hypothetical protein
LAPADGLQQNLLNRIREKAQKAHKTSHFAPFVHSCGYVKNMAG